MCNSIYDTENLTSNQQKWMSHYRKLCERGRFRILNEYKENHHVLPECMGGTGLLEDKVYLTPEEHFVAHQFLVKIFPENNELAFACNMMCVDGNGKRIHNKRFGWIKRRTSRAMSNLFKGQTKETSDRVARMAITLTDRTKNTHQHVLDQSIKMTGRNAQNHEGIARMTEKQSSVKMDLCLEIVKMKDELNLAFGEILIAVKPYLETNYNCIRKGYYRGLKFLDKDIDLKIVKNRTGRTKENNSGVASCAEKNTKLHFETGKRIVLLRDLDKFSFGKIQKKLESEGLKFSISTIQRGYSRTIKSLVLFRHDK